MKHFALGTCLFLAGATGTIAGAATLPKDPSDATPGALLKSDFGQIPDAPTQLTSAKLVDADGSVPAYCRVDGYVAPQVGFELFLPVSTWNGKFLEVGSGGAAGFLPAATDFSEFLRRGYACVASDMGHKGTGGDGLWASNDWQTKIDWAFRSTHVTALAAKAIIGKFYGTAARKSYFMGCSTGGRQGLIEAQRFPGDFDGIIAGAPAVSEAGTLVSLLWNYRALNDGAGNPLLGPTEIQWLQDAIKARFGTSDGTQDGLVSDPRLCRFDPSELLRKEGAATGGLTPAQVEAVRKIYAGPTTSSGKELYEGSGRPLTNLMAIYRVNFVFKNLIREYFRYMAFVPDAGPGWDFGSFDFDRDYQRLATTEALYDASNPDLRQFRAAGGKLIIYHGWNDEATAPLKTIDYYETVEKVMGGRAATSGFFRLFMVPGMNHCTGGDGAFAIDYLGYLDDWVDNGHAPDRMVGAHVNSDNRADYSIPVDPAKVTFTRPVFPYPRLARYKGDGDPDSAESFVSFEP